MQLIKEHSAHLVGFETQVWNGGYFNDVIVALVEARDGQRVRAEFENKFLKKYHDIAVYTVLRLSYVLKTDTFLELTDISNRNYASSKRNSEMLENVISILSQFGTPPPTDHEFENFYTDLAKIGQKNKATLTSVTSYRQRVQAAWLAVLRNNLDASQRKNLLRMMSHQIAPWFLKPELLMDFLTYS